MKKICILFLVFINSYACSLCDIYSPVTTVSLNVNSTSNKITNVEVKWILTKVFTDSLKDIYDQNLNKKFDDNEIKLIEDSFLVYAKANHYMTHISYDEIVNKNVSKKVIVKDFKTYIKNNILHFTYIMPLNYALKNDYILYLKFEDKEKYFVLNIDKESTTFKNVKNQKLIKDGVVSFMINSNTKFPKIVEEEIIKKSEPSLKKVTLLDTYKEKFKQYLLRVKDGDIFALVMLCLVSFIYGIVHALGPGHGKSLAFAYFTSNKSSYAKAFMVSQASAFIHILGALILVLISIFILQSMLNSFVTDSVEILTKISAVFIIILSIYIFYKKLKKESCSCSSCKQEEVITWSQKSPNNTFVKPMHKKINKKEDIFFILTAGLIPCPGTVVLFIYAFVLKTYFAVMLASIFISLGMGLVIFLASLFAVSLRKASSSSHKLTNFLEIVSPVFMFILGVLLYFNFLLF